MPEKSSKEMARVKPSRISPYETMERWFEDIFRRPFPFLEPSWWPRLRVTEMEEFTPSLDIFEENNDVVVKAELPGIKKEDIDVNVTDNTLTISGEKKHEEKVEKNNYYRVERSYGSFTRSVTLPTEVQTDKVKASFKDGILEIRAPRTEESKRKEMKVKIG